MKKIFYILFSFLCTLVLYSFSFASVSSTHPRLYLDSATMTRLVSMANANDAKYTAMIGAVNGGSSVYFLPAERMISNALAYKIKAAKGDSDAMVYANRAIDYIFNGYNTTMDPPIIVTGTVTAIDNNSITDSTKTWELSAYTGNNLDVNHMYYVCPNVNQDKYWYMNRGYMADGTYPAYTANRYYVHPRPEDLLGAGLTGAEPRSVSMTSSASVGSTYVIVSGHADSLKVSAQGVALAYDWLYDVLTPAQRSIIRAYLRIAGEEALKMYYGVALFSWTNYTTDGLRDIGSIAYALYGDDPYGATLLSALHNKYTSEIQPSLNWITEGGQWPEGEAYGSASVQGWLLFMRMAKDVEGINYFTASEAQLRARLNYTMLLQYPTVLTGFANNGSIKYKSSLIFSDGARDRPLTYDSQRLSSFVIMREFPNSTEAKTAMTHFSSDGLTRVEARYMLCWELLLYPTSQTTLPIANAPTENISLNGGIVQMRSSWSDTSNATIALFKSSPKTHYHSHLDANSFHIYKYSDLAPYTGVYPGSGGDVYYPRTVATNAMLFYDSTEDSWQNIQGNDYSAHPNDGGQREVRTYNASGTILNQGSWQTSGLTVGDDPLLVNGVINPAYDHGKITAYGAGASYVYTVGDASKAYDGNTHKVTRAIRKFLYIRPDVFVVQDVYNLKNTSIEPNFVLHSVDGMTVTGTETVVQADGQYNYTGGNKVTVTNGGGKLVMDTVYPASVAIRKIGGTNRRQWIDGVNYTSGEYYGKWRAEVRPATVTTDGQMLNVLQATSSAGTTLSTAAINGTNGRGVLIGGNTVAMFSNAQSGTVSSMSYSATTTAASTHYVVDLAPSTTYNIRINGGTTTAYTSTSAGVITFSNSATGAQSYSVVK